jgi:PEGA domain
MVAQYDPENRILLCYNPWRAMQHKLRTMAAVFMPAVLLLAADAHAARLAVVALPSPHGQAPVEEADALTSHLIKRRHRTIASADATERLLSGNAGAGPDWAVGLAGEIRRGREALTRLDRHAADRVRREVQESIERMGGGAGGAEVLVEWALLESALASSAGDGTRATRWIDRAATLGPTVILDPLVHPEAERQAFQDATDRVREVGEGTLTVVTVPAAAELWVDGVRRCRTSCTVSLPPGQHFARVTSPAHAPAVLSVQLASDQSATRRVGLTSAYTGASIEAIEAMLDNPSRASEAQSSLSALADFLDVDHVVVLRRTSKQSYSIRVAPVLEGNDAVRGGLSANALSSSADAMLQPARSARSTATPDGAWYESTALWVGVASVAVVAVGAGLLLSRGDDSTPPSHGTLVIGGR